MTSQRPTIKNRPSQRGGALITILWIVGILSTAVFTSSHFLLSGLEAESASSSAFQAELLADRGIAIASHQKIERGDPILSARISEVSGYQARISSAGNRLNLNTLLSRPEQDRIVLEELFYQWGLRSDEAVEVVDSLIDWVDTDDKVTGQGAELAQYLGMNRRNQPFNRPFRTLEEVELVRGFDRVSSANPGWRSAFTLLSSGALDLNEAPAELISAACQCSFESARLFVVTRDGFDEIPGTDDDPPRIEGVDEALLLLGIPDDARPLVQGRVTVNDPVRLIISRGSHGDLTIEREVTIRYSSGRANILGWKTRRL